MSFTLINQYIIVIQMISHDSIKYSYCITHILKKITNFFRGDIYTCFIAFNYSIQCFCYFDIQRQNTYPGKV